MQIKSLRWIIILLLAGLGFVPASAQSGAQITSFTTPFTEVGRSALLNRTARIPVSWTSINRPLTANLVFEQILPGGTTINVELPRVIPWVASNGDGVAAPVLPGNSATSIRLRVSLVDLFSNGVYDSEEIIIPVISGDTGGDGSGSVAAIIAFNADYNAPVNRAELNSGNVRLPVSWQAINRPTWMNLVFEQILPDGTVHNVELPRSNPWVNSSDRGMVAPTGVGDIATEIVLRVRLVSFFEDRTYDQFYTYVPIQSQQGAPEITTFYSRIGSIASEGVAGNSLIDVTWSVVNRPQGTNLLFEQIMPDGTLQNVELPRDFPIVPSAGEGVIDPVLPAEFASELLFQLRLVDLSTNNTLDTATLSIGLTEYPNDNRLVVTGDACYQTPLPSSIGITNGSEVRVQTFDSDRELEVYESQTSVETVTTVPAGTLLVVRADPYCSYFPETTGSGERRWFVEGNGFQGWVEEYRKNGDNYVRYILPSTATDIPVVSVQNFSISPRIVSASDLDSTEFIFSWQTSHASAVSISQMMDFTSNVNGSTTVSGSTFNTIDQSQTFEFVARDTQSNLATAEVTLTVGSAVSINDFSANLAEVQVGNDVVFNWDISGEFASAHIEYDYDPGTLAVSVVDVTQNTGSETYTVPDYVWADEKTISLVVEDTAGTILRHDIALNVTCAHAWQLSVGETDCPFAAHTATGAYQAFERGFMLWVPGNGGATIYAFYDDGTAFATVDQWDGQDYVIEGTPGEGLLVPERGFGYLWNTDASVRNSLGWATSAEQSYLLTSQTKAYYLRNSPYTSYYTLPDGRIVQLDSTGGLSATYIWNALS